MRAKLNNKEESYHEFTLVLHNVHEFRDNLEDMLFEAGCSDALMHYGNTSVYLDFTRKAVNLQSAIRSAIKDIESARIDLNSIEVRK